PAVLLVVCEHLRQSVGPAARERSRQARLELLYRCACLEPGDAAGDRHSQHRPPGPREHELDCARRLHVRTDPRLSVFARRQGPRMPDLRTSMLQVNRAAQLRPRGSLSDLGTAAIAVAALLPPRSSRHLSPHSPGNKKPYWASVAEC